MNIIIAVIIFLAGLCMGVLLSCLLISEKLNHIDDDVLDRIEKMEKQKEEDND